MPIANIDVKFPRVDNYKENGVVFPIVSTTWLVLLRSYLPDIVRGRPFIETVHMCYSTKISVISTFPTIYKSTIYKHDCRT